MTDLLIFAALLPAVILCIYVYKKDRVEKEPIGLLLKLLFLGAVSCFPAGEVEGFLIPILEKLVPPENNLYLYTFLETFFCVGLVEEGCKLFMLIIATRRNEEYNSLFDGFIYAIFVSLGFAALENVMYVLRYGFMNAVMRGILSVPGHMFFSVVMGYFYTLWNLNARSAKVEKYYKSIGRINPAESAFRTKGYMASCLVFPMLIHGFYNFCCSVPSFWATLVFYVFIIIMYIRCFRKINEMSRLDTYSGNIVQRAIIREYPELSEDILGV